ncbi:MAG: Gfo/Idh/MocA family oxidoreductase, partial [Gammaproteobacteria bacterium]|nr:Gfo/Idh/MocA family oxidoreductase [Gammaproteobacteria bacterium]
MVHQACAQGRFGEQALITCYVPWWRDDAYYAPPRWQGSAALDGGGALMNQSIHGVDLVQWFAQAAFGHAQPVQEVFCYSARLAHDAALMEVEDSAVLSLRFVGGGLGQILATTASFPGSLRRFHLGGRGGSVELLEEQLLSWQFAQGIEADAGMLQRFGADTGHAGAVRDPFAMDFVNHQRNLEAFLAALEDERPPELDGREARKAVAITLAAYQSARLGQPVRLS